jgi:hypothetical protein
MREETHYKKIIFSHSVLFNELEKLCQKSPFQNHWSLLCIWPDSEPTKLFDHPKTKNLGGEGASPATKSISNFLWGWHFTALSISLIFLRVKEKIILCRECFIFTVQLRLTSPGLLMLRKYKNRQGGTVCFIQNWASLGECTAAKVMVQSVNLWYQKINLINALLMLTLRNIYLFMTACSVDYAVCIVDPEPIKGSGKVDSPSVGYIF